MESRSFSSVAYVVALYSIERTRKECNWVAFLHCDGAQLIVSSIGIMIKWFFIIVMTKELFLGEQGFDKSWIAFRVPIQLPFADLSRHRGQDL